VRRETPKFPASMLVAALWVAFAAVLPPSVAPATAQPAAGNQGMMTGWVMDDAGRIDFPGSRVGQFRSVREAGAGWVRIEFRLGLCFNDWTSPGCATAQGANALAVYDLVVDEARGAGLQVLGLIDYTSWPGVQDQWLANNAEQNATERYPNCRDDAGRYSGGCNAFIESFAQGAARVVAEHFNGVNGPLVDNWEIWNEPNAFTESPSTGVYRGGYFVYPSNFAWILRLSYEAIKAAQPNATVISGGLFAFDITEPQTRSGVYEGVAARSRCSANLASGQSGAAYLCATYEMGRLRAGWRPGTAPFDHVGQHIYADQWKRTSRESLLRYLLEVRYAYREYEGESTPKQIYITEVGWTTDTVSMTVQAENLQTAFEEVFRPTPFVARAFWFLFQDEPAARLSYGLRDPDGAPKPTLEAFRRSAAY
jgi:hypothetical protein